MRKVLDIFAYNRGLVTDELAALRYRAACRPGLSKAFAAMVPAPCQGWISALAHTEADIAKLQNKTLIVHGRKGRVILAF